MSVDVALASAAGLPVGAALPSLREALRGRHEAVLEAAPGAGKTTVVPLALLGEPWLGGRSIVMLEPRRMAARAAAARMAELLGETVGETVGYRVRLESRVGPATRIEVVTEGVLTRRLQSDPALDGVGLLIFDEFHERSLDADVGLALALQGREWFREADEPLRILVMSATLDGEATAALLGDAPRIRAEGRQHPVQLRYRGAPARGQPLASAVVEAVRDALAEGPGEGSVLIFLPGQAEIRDLARALAVALPGPPGELEIAPLHGALSLEQQQRALRPPAPGRQKLVLATNIAETSLTIEGVVAVVDAGRVREAVYDPGTAMSRLRTVPVSRAASAQRAGRAGRLGPGRCYRLWEESAQARLAAAASPEILRTDLAPLALQLLGWGVADPGELRWLDSPPGGAWSQALALLVLLGAVEDGAAGQPRLTSHGEAMAGLPLHPRLAHMLLRARSLGLGELACEVAALLAERDPLPGEGADLVRRLELLRGGDARLRGWRQRQRQQAARYRRQLAGVGESAVPALAASALAVSEDERPGVLLALAYPDRVARRRSPGGVEYQLANGRAAALSPGDVLANRPWLVVADLGGRVGEATDRIYLAAALAPEQLEGVLADLVKPLDRMDWDAATGRFVAERSHRVGSLVLRRERLTPVDPEQRRRALLHWLTRQGLTALPWTESSRQWRARVELMRRAAVGVGAAGAPPWPDLSDSALLASLPAWLGPYLDPVEKLADLARVDLAAALRGLLPWELNTALERLAPTHWEVPSGSRVAIDYVGELPVLAVRMQEMFGCTRTPAIAGGAIPLTLELLSPARRPLQVTRDLPGFWAGSYQQVRKEMRGRYPKHAWPEDPAGAQPLRGTRRRS